MNTFSFLLAAAAYGSVAASLFVTWRRIVAAQRPVRVPVWSRRRTWR